MRRARRLRLQGGVNPLSDAVGLIPRLAPAPGRDLPDAADALLTHTPSPQRDGAAMDSERDGVRLRGLAAGRGDDDPRPQHDLLRRRTGPDPLLKTDGLRLRQNHQDAFS